MNNSSIPPMTDVSPPEAGGPLTSDAVRQLSCDLNGFESGFASWSRQQERWIISSDTQASRITAQLDQFRCLATMLPASVAQRTTTPEVPG